MPLVDQARLEAAIGTRRVQRLYDDDGNGVINAAALALTFQRADTNVYSFLAKEWDGPFPMPSPPPDIAVEAALLYAIGMSFSRKPEEPHYYGEKGNAGLVTAAEKLCKELVANTRRMVTNGQIAPEPANVQCFVDFDNGTAGGIGGGTFSGGFGDF